MGCELHRGQASTRRGGALLSGIGAMGFGWRAARRGGAPGALGAATHHCSCLVPVRGAGLLRHVGLWGLGVRGRQDYGRHEYFADLLRLTRADCFGSRGVIGRAFSLAAGCGGGDCPVRGGARHR